MKIKKIIALLASAAIAASMAVPVMAAGVEDNLVQSVTVAAQLRAKEAEFTSINANSCKFVEDGANIEVNGATYMGAYYSFANDLSALPTDATISSVTLNIDQPTASTHKNITYTLVPVTNIDNTDTATIFSKVSAAINAETPVTLTTSASTSEGDYVISTDVTSVFDKDADANAYFLYLPGAGNAKRNLGGGAELVITYSYEAPVASIGTTTYESLEAAVKAVAEGDTIELLADADLTERILLGNSSYNVPKTFTISGNGYTITAPSGQSLAIELASGYNVTLKNLTVTGGNSNAVNIKGGATLTAEDVNFVGSSNTKVGLTVSGYGSATLTDSTIEYAKLYGTLNLNGASTVNNVYIPQIKPGTSDVPVIAVNDTSTVTGSLTIDKFDTTNASIEGYTLVTGNVSAFAPTYDDGTYVLTDGVFASKTTGPVETASPVASAVIDGETKTFEDLPSAIDAVADRGTITLLKDVELTAPIYLKKNITIESDGKKITAASGAAVGIEVTNWYSLTLKNTSVEGGTSCNIDVKGNSSLTAENVTLSVLNVGGNGTATLKNSSVNTAQLYGNLKVTEGSTVANVVLLAINPAGVDKPTVELDDTSSVTGTLTLSNGVTPVENYTLVTGTVANFAPTYDDGTYVLENGVFVKKVIPEVITMTPAFVGAYEGDTDGSKAVAYTASFTSSTGATASLNVGEITWKLDDATLKVADDNAVTNVTVTLSGNSAVVYGIIISGVAAEGTLTAVFN